MWFAKWTESEDFAKDIIDNWDLLMKHDRVDSMEYFRNFSEQMERADIEIVCDCGRETTRHCGLYLMLHDKPVYGIEVYKVTFDSVAHALDELLNYAYDIIGCNIAPLNYQRRLDTLDPLDCFVLENRVYMLVGDSTNDEVKEVRTAMSLSDGNLVRVRADTEVRKVVTHISLSMHPDNTVEGEK